MAKIKMMASKVGYNLVAGNYDKKEKYLNSFEQFKVLPLLKDIQGKKVLDVGAGTGRISLALAKLGGEVTALDISPNMLAILHKKNSSLKTVVGDAQNLPFKDNSFDYIVSAFVVVHFKDPKIFFKEAYRVLKDGGKLIITNINQKEPPELKTEKGFIKIQSFYHRPERIVESLEELAFKIEKNMFVYDQDIWINQIILCEK